VPGAVEPAIGFQKRLWGIGAGFVLSLLLSGEGHSALVATSSVNLM
jgi:hypothetical protein